MLKTSCEKNGNTYLPKIMLMDEASKSLELDLEGNQSKFDEAFDSLTLDRTAVALWLDNTEIVMLSRYYYYENSIAQKLTWLANCQKEDNFDVSAEIELFEQRNQISLHEEQKNAVVGAMPEGDEKGVATVGPGVYVGANAKIGPNAMVKENVKDGEEQW